MSISPKKESEWWYLESLVTSSRKIEIILIEGITGADDQEIDIGGKPFVVGKSIDVMPQSRRVQLVFERYVAFQVLDESFSSYDDTEVHERERTDKLFYQTITQSKYLEYVNREHGWYADVVGSAKQYRIWTLDDVIEVVAYEEPTFVELMMASYNEKLATQKTDGLISLAWKKFVALICSKKGR